jgi:hypothetical protein
MAHYAVFFAGEVGAGIQPVQAMDRGHAEDIVRALHPDSRLSVIEAEQLEGVDRMQVLLAWLETLDPGAESVK